MLGGGIKFLSSPAGLTRYEIFDACSVILAARRRNKGEKLQLSANCFILTSVPLDRRASLTGNYGQPPPPEPATIPSIDCFLVHAAPLKLVEFFGKYSTRKLFFPLFWRLKKIREQAICLESKFIWN